MSVSDRYQTWIDGKFHCGSSDELSGLYGFYGHVDILPDTSLLEFRVDGAVEITERGAKNDVYAEVTQADIETTHGKVMAAMQARHGTLST